MDGLAVEARGIEKSYRTASVTIPVLAGIDLNVEVGECVFLAGPSGSGKSTLLSILGCILSADSGGLRIFGAEVARLSAEQRAQFRRERIGFVFQRFHLVDGLCAWENVKVPLDLLGWRGRAARLESVRLLEQVGMHQLAERRIDQLSLGQRQRVALARALAGDPDILLADEPTASLDFESGHNAMRILHDLAKRLGKTTIVVTHDARIYPMADRILTIEDGRFTMVRYNSTGPLGALVQRL